MTESKTHNFERNLKSRRLIHKNGACNISKPEFKKNVFSFAVLVNASWCFTIFIFLVVLLISWLLFAIIWWVICYTHGDFESNHLPNVQKANNFVPCVYQMHNFYSCVLFSIETHHTVGYGIKATTQECPEAIFVNALQCIIGFITQGVMATIIFSKMTLPKLRSRTLLFSKNAVISIKNNKLCLMFRVGDMRKNHIINANIRVFFVRSERTVEGEVLHHSQTELPVCVDDCKTNLFFHWPLIVSHEIDEDSPLYSLSAKEMSQSFFEIIVLLEGTVGSTEQETQARTSYTSSEVLWGKQFENIMLFNNEKREFEVNFSKFDDVVDRTTPLCSSIYLEESSSDKSRSSSRSTNGYISNEIQLEEAQEQSGSNENTELSQLVLNIDK